MYTPTYCSDPPMTPRTTSRIAVWIPLRPPKRPPKSLFRPPYDPPVSVPRPVTGSQALPWSDLVWLLDSYIGHGMASTGGGISVQNAATLYIEHSAVVNNNASNNEPVFLKVSDSTSTQVNKMLPGSGGGLMLQDQVRSVGQTNHR
eukprot:1190923-Prorocentrum_minimum.AAC.2